MKAGRSVTRRAATVGLAAATAAGFARKAAAQSERVGPKTAGELRIERVNPRGLVKPRGYTQVVTAPLGRTVHISGQVSIDEAGALVGKGDLKAQVDQVFANLRLALAGVGAGPRDIVKTNTYVVNARPEDVAVFRDARDAFFAGVEPPASTFVGVTSLANPDWLVEVEAVAMLPPQASLTLVR